MCIAREANNRCDTLYVAVHMLSIESKVHVYRCTDTCYPSNRSPLFITMHILTIEPNPPIHCCACAVHRTDLKSPSHRCAHPNLINGIPTQQSTLYMQPIEHLVLPLSAQCFLDSDSDRWHFRPAVHHYCSFPHGTETPPPFVHHIHFRK